MGNFATRGSRFIYEDCGSEETLLDLDDFFFNKAYVIKEKNDFVTHALRDAVPSVLRLGNQ